MDNFVIARWILVFLSAVAVSAELDPRLHHYYLSYISPYEFLQGFSKNRYVYEPFRSKRSVSSYAYHPMMHPIRSPMSYAYGMGFNSMYNPYKMMGFPSFRFPMMHGFNLMGMDPYYSYGYSSSKRSSGEQSASNYGYNSKMSYSSANPASHPFGGHFMKMMGFSFNKVPNIQSPVNGQFGFNNFHIPSFGNGRFSFDNMKFPSSSGKGNNYERSYSKSYSMNMDYKDGKGRMVTKDSSYKNDNGKVEMHNNPARHYTFTGNGKPVPDNNYH